MKPRKCLLMISGGIDSPSPFSRKALAEKGGYKSPQTASSICYAFHSKYVVNG